MKKIKIFKPMVVGSDQLESDINAWVIEQNVDIIDVKINTFETIQSTCCFATVIYEEREK